MKIDKVLDELKTENVKDKTTLTELLIQAILNSEKSMSASECTALKAFTVAELKTIVDVLPTLPTYKQKSEMIDYADNIGKLFAFSAQKIGLTKEERLFMRAASEVIDEQSYPHNRVDYIFESKNIDDGTVAELIDSVRQMTEECRRGVFTAGLLHYRDELKRLSAVTVERIREYLKDEFRRFLAMGDSLGGEAADYMEILADACDFFVDGEMLGLIKQAAELPFNNIRMYCILTSLHHGEPPTDKQIEDMMSDIKLADLFYSELDAATKKRVPSEYSDGIYLAKSRLVFWLVYPTELGKLPDAIECFGRGTSHGEELLLFKFKSDSDNLTEELKNQWLIGWTQPDGNAFSSFEPLSHYEKGTDEKTVKNIMRKMFGA